MKLSLKAIQEWQEGAEERLQNLEILIEELKGLQGQVDRLTAALTTTNERVHTNHCDITCLEQAVESVRNDIEDMTNEKEDDEEDLLS